ncbi:helix-turn-helix domain-containing protein [Agrobacterium radiobacter]|uniref:helix-turn-helix domain-containing protein n=1 Tax=Agrobacterium tumefaciens complex TaxID=1183400 RepID=UPI00080FAA1B|nr:helix-turn-helix transcriptional regulator [Agrobacterium tumefaciens]NTA05404.1 helix-turn-helix domain-containing protein [Agrobacterium tumefaciens]NTA91997.1 helix-turn-helix domain-containing protein [Agrobacterium tumefaciens]OCJ32159.1 hypothetical protein A6U90_09590 [Agrobacterium tumefaciens]
MIVITGKTNSSQSQAVIRHKDFAKRLGIACENSPQAPAAHGRQIWLKNQLEAQFNEPVSREAVRKWFAGEAKPKPKMMSLVARALGVDEAWLAIGSTPNITVSEKKSRNILASGAANMVAAQIQLAGGSVAFPDEAGVGIDLDTIVKGRRKTVAARPGVASGAFRVSLPLSVGAAIIVIPTDAPTVYRFFNVPETIMNDEGKVRGEYTEIDCEFAADRLIIGNKEIPEIVDFTNIEGVVQSSKAKR